MSNILRAVALGLLLASLCLAQKKGSISGSIASVAGEPLKNATLTLTMQQPPPSPGAPPQPRPQFSASTDAQGNFTLDDLDPGVYFLCSDKPGYIRSCVQRDFDLAAGQTLTGIDIQMTPQAIISGKVTDEYGDPYPNARVSTARWGYVGGYKQLQPYGGGGNANAEGGFAIGGLQAGSYFLQVAPALGGITPVAIQKGQEETFVTTYYPSVTDPAGAIAIQVTAGAAMRGIEIRIHKAHAYRIRGELVGVTAPGSNVRLARYGTQNGVVTSPPAADGGFDFEGVLPGVYVLSWTSQTSVARQVVTVGDMDVVDLAVQAGPGAEITGKISFDGAAPEIFHSSISLESAQGMPGTSNSSIKGDGTFAITRVLPSLYRVEMHVLPPGYYLKSVRFGGQDVLKAPLDLTSGSGGTMDVVLSPNAADVSGIVHGADGMPRASMTVMLWRPGTPIDGVADLTRTVNTDANGQFKFASLPPGEYRIAAWEQYDPGLTPIPDFRSQFESKAATVTLEEGAHANIEAPLIPRDAIEAAAAKLN